MHENDESISQFLGVSLKEGVLARQNDSLLRVVVLFMIVVSDNLGY